MSSLKIVFLIFGLSQIVGALACVGCNEKDEQDAGVVDFLKSVLSHCTSNPQGTENENIEFVKINNVQTQVVSGMKYNFNFQGRGLKTHKLYNCEMVALSKPWKSFEKILSYTCQSTTPDRKKRSALNSEVAVDVDNDEHLLGLKTYVEEELNRVLESEYLLRIVKFYKATQRIVSGILTTATFEVAKTDCPTNANFFGNCIDQKQGRQVCTVQVWERLWLNERKMTLKNCNEIPEFCSGCEYEVSSGDEMASQLLRRALFTLNENPEAEKQWKVNRITKVVSQVVAGMKYTIEFDALDQHNSNFGCSAVVVTEPWVSQEPIIHKFECVPVVDYFNFKREFFV